MSEGPHEIVDTVRTKATEVSLVTEQLSKRQNYKELLALLKQTYPWKTQAKKSFHAQHPQFLKLLQVLTLEACSFKL